MKNRLVILTACVAMAGAACRQPDGPVPALTDSRANDVGDVARDMVNISRRDLQGPKDLADDLKKFSPIPEGEAAAAELARRIADVLNGRNLPDNEAERLAQALWVGISARELSENQVESLQNDVRSILTSTGVPENDAQSVAAQLGEVQEIVTVRTKRWYEFF